MPSVSAGTQIIPASLKERQWKDFSCIIDRLSGRKRDAGAELRLLHHVFSSGANLGILYGQKKDLESMMHYIDMPGQMFQEFAPMLANSGALKVLAISALMEEHAKNLGVEVEFAPSVRGALRAYGWRRMNDCGWHTVFGSPVVILGVDSADGSYDLEKNDAYYPPSASLLSLWRAMCKKYDSLRQSAASFDDALLAESFFQLIGTRALHPFMDGNGRTFGAHLALALHCQGLALMDFPCAHELMKSLSPMHDGFVSDLLRDAGLGFVSGSGHIKIALDCAFREDYMRRLTSALEAAIEGGTSPQGTYYRHILALRDEINAHL